MTPRFTPSRALRAGPRSVKGFSLVELSIGLIILGALMAGGVYLLDMSSKRSATDKLNPVRMAEHALVAYAHAKGQLPPPKDEEAGAPAGYRQGKVPWAELGLPDAGAVRYVVDQAMLSATQANTYRPNLRGEPLNDGPSQVLGGAGRPVARADFCQRLLNLQRTAKPLSHGLSAAFLTAEPSDAAYQNAQARGHAELAAQYGCVELLAELHGHVLALYAMRDHKVLLEHIKLPIDMLSVASDTERLAFDATNALFYANRGLLLAAAGPTALSQGLTSWITGAPTAAATTAAAGAGAAAIAPGAALQLPKAGVDLAFLADSGFALAATTEQVALVNNELTSTAEAYVKHFQTY